MWQLNANWGGGGGFVEREKDGKLDATAAWIYSFVYSECDADNKKMTAYRHWTTDRGQTSNKDNGITRMLLFSLAS